ncbi:MAG TPA: methionine--tRNA ligase subunit beta [Candidatus Paceibacterota bacterium]|nr:methionine--tRNA ligase subunit beta [Candidatus Paceibacterota bacterium]
MENENPSTSTEQGTAPQVALEVAPAPVYATIDDFAKIEIKIGTILTAEFIEGADKLLRLTIDFGEAEPRQILSGIRKYYTPEELVGKQCPFVVNLAPRTMKGLTSYGMILAARTGDDKLALLHPNIPTDVGAHVG